MAASGWRRWLLAAVGAAVLPVIGGWNWVVGLRARSLPREADPTVDSRIVEHVRSWGRYLRGFDAHHGPGGHPDRSPEEGRLVDGLAAWTRSRFLRGYTLGNDVYLCPAAPRPVRVHQAGHTPAFGEVFDPIVGDRRADGGLPDEPLRTLDVMLPGNVPHTFLRLTDRRGLAGAYRAWYYDGRVERVRE